MIVIPLQTFELLAMMESRTESVSLQHISSRAMVSAPNKFLRNWSSVVESIGAIVLSATLRYVFGVTGKDKAREMNVRESISAQE